MDYVGREHKNGRLELRMAVRLPVEVRKRGLGLQPRLNEDPVCDDSAAEVAYAARSAMKDYLTFYLVQNNTNHCTS